MIKRWNIILIMSILMLSFSCKKNNPVIPEDPLDTSAYSGTSSFTYTLYPPFQNKPIEVYYHIPESADKSTPILIAFHGAGRDGAYSRTALVAKANQLNFIVVVPEFSKAYFPGGDAYNLGNVFDDGDHPSAATLNDREDWTFSVIEPLFEHFKTQIASDVTTYDVFGHSAGGQFAHRLFLLNADFHFNRVVAAASGWYTVPDTGVTFPYGLGKSPVQASDLPDIFSRKLTITVGDKDTNPNSSALRHTNEADLQGMQRLERAKYFYNESSKIAAGMGAAFEWKLKVIPNVAHDYSATSSHAADLLYK